LIELKGITKSYRIGTERVDALRGVELSADKGSFISVSGASGSGKTTLVNILGCLDRPTTGEYLLDGEAVSHLAPRRLSELRSLRIGFVFQNFNLLPRLTALQNVELPLVFRGVQPAERRRRAERALADVGLEDRLLHRPKELSGGQQQRVAVARALVGEPSILLADEPTGNLDGASGLDVLRLFGILNERGVTIILITHDAHVASAARRRLLLENGLLKELH